MSWPKKELETLGEFKNGVNFSSDKMGRGYPLINVKDITDSKFLREESLQRVDIELSADSDYFAKEGDIFFVRSSVKRDGAGSAGMLLSDTGQTIHCGFVIRFRPTSQELLSGFLLYYLQAATTRDEVRNLASGATIYNISQASLKKLRIPLPPINVQHRIACVLKTYDDLIGNNLRRIQLLEEAARCRYRLLMENCLVGVSVLLADLYETSSGGTPSRTRQEYYGGSIPWFKTKELQDSVLLDSEEKITDQGLSNSSAKVFQQGTVLLAMYGATIGRLGMLSMPAATNQACCAIIPKQDPYSNYFIYLFLLENRDYVLSFRMGAAQENISQVIVKNLLIPKVEEVALSSFNQQVSPLFSMIEKLSRQNVLLQQARDIILPRLMSGEIDVASMVLPDTLVAETLETA